MSALVNAAAGEEPLASPVGVDELKRAWRAVRAGDFRTPNCRDRGDRRYRPGAADAWTPEPQEELLMVLGCAGSSGATTVALAMALSVMTPVRVVECGSLTASGLASASTAELGLHAGGGWMQGRRDHVHLARASELLPGPHAVPHPISVEGSPIPGAVEADEAMTPWLTILDAGWEAGQVLITDSWIAETARTVEHLVLTTRATAPGLRRLEGALDLLSRTRDVGQVQVAVLGPVRRKWHRGLEHAGGPGVRAVLDAGTYVEIPEIPALAASGLDSRPLPVALVDAAARLLPTHQQFRCDLSPTRTPRTDP